jgi:thiamine-phosphate pyrophosphorylase
VTDRRALRGARASSSEPAGPSAIEIPTSEFSERSREVFCKTIRNAAAAGVDWIQIREKDLAGHALTELVRLAIAESRGTRARILVNDRLDVALAAGAAGIHLGEMSLPAAAVANWRRSSGRTEFQIGVSCHSLESARAAERDGADYIFFGPVFATPSKAAFGPPQGIDLLREVCESVGIPVLAIGGVTIENARSCVAARAAGIAAIRLFQQQENLAEQIARVREI